MEIIILPHGKKKEIADKCNVSTVTLWKALTGRSNSKKAKKLRKIALENGGQIYTPQK